MSPPTMNKNAYKSSICGFSMMGPITRYAAINKNKIGITMGTCKENKSVLSRFKKEVLFKYPM